jgi:hypothetical protein
MENAAVIIVGGVFRSSHQVERVMTVPYRMA